MVAHRWAIHTKQLNPKLVELAESTGVSYARITGFRYGMSTARLVHTNGKMLRKGVHQKVTIAPLSRRLKEDLTIPKLFGAKVFEVGVVYDLDELMEEVI